MAFSVGVHAVEARDEITRRVTVARACGHSATGELIDKTLQRAKPIAQDVRACGVAGFPNVIGTVETDE